MRLFAVVVLSISSLLCYAQRDEHSIDSLRKAYSEAEDEIHEIQLLDELGISYMMIDFDSALFFFEKGINKTIKIKNDTLLASLYNNIGRVYTYIGITDESLKYILKSIEIYKGVGLNVKLIGGYNNVGVIYYRNENLEKALEYYQLAEQEANNNKDELGERYSYILGVLLNNIGSILENLDKDGEALETYFSGLRYSREYGDKINVANLHSNIGLAYKKSSQFDLALSNMKEAINVRTDIKDDFGLARSYMHLGNLIVKSEGSLDSAAYYFQKSISLAEKVGSPEIIIRSAEALSNVYINLNMPSEAHESLVLHDYWEDSIKNDKTQKLITELELKHRYEETQKERELAQAEKEKKNFIIISLLILISAGSVLLYLLQRVRSKNNYLQKNSLELSNRNLALENETLEQQLEFRSKELTTNVMYLMKKNELLNDVSTRLIELKKNLKKENTQPVQKIIFDINTVKDSDTWEEFELRFQQVYNDFYDRLLERFPDLSINDKKLCAFLRLDLSSKEISTITGQTLNSLNVARTRLRKKMGLQTDDNLSSYLSQL